MYRFKKRLPSYLHQVQCKMLWTILHYRECSECTNRGMESVFATTPSTHPECTTGMQSISETDATGTPAA